MNLDNLILKLQAIREEYGNIQAHTASDDEMNEVNPVWSVGVFFQNEADPEIIYNDMAEAESDDAHDCVTPIVII